MPHYFGPGRDMCKCGEPRSKHGGPNGHGGLPDLSKCAQFTWSHFNEDGMVRVGALLGDSSASEAYSWYMDPAEVPAFLRGLSAGVGWLELEGVTVSSPGELDALTLKQLWVDHSIYPNT